MKYTSLPTSSFTALVKVLLTSMVLLSAPSFAQTPGTSTAELKQEIAKNANKFGVQATVTAAQGKGSQLAAALLMAANVAKNIEGCEIYLVQLSKDTPDLLLLTEIWSNQEAHKASLENPEIRNIIESARPLIDKIDHKWGLPLGGKGL